MKKPKAEKTFRNIANHTARAIDKARPERRKKGRIDRKKLAEVLAYFDSLPVDDPRSPEEIIGYDELGVPK
jgi:hypothetical protein